MAEMESEATNRGKGGKKRPPRVHAVVLLCGMNDLKRMPVQPGSRSPQHFQRDLKGLCDGIHEIVGPQTPILLPALPIHWCLGFPQPLRSVLVSVASVWDGRKELLAREEDFVDYVPVPSRPTISDSEIKVHIAGDGIHPNEKGYEKWGEVIAQKITERLAAEKRHRRLSKL